MLRVWRRPNSRTARAQHASGTAQGPAQLDPAPLDEATSQLSADATCRLALLAPAQLPTRAGAALFAARADGRVALLVLDAANARSTQDQWSSSSSRDEDEDELGAMRCAVAWRATAAADGPLALVRAGAFSLVAAAHSALRVWTLDACSLAPSASHRLTLEALPRSLCCDPHHTALGVLVDAKGRLTYFNVDANHHEDLLLSDISC